MALLAGIVGPSGTPLGGIVYADTFLPGASGPVVVTSAVPLVLTWPGEGAETEACDGTRVGPARYCSPRHEMSLNSRDEGSNHIG